VRFIRSDIPSFFIPSFTDLTLQSVALTPKFKLDLPLLGGNRLVVGVDGYFDHANVATYSNISRSTTTLETQVSKATLGVYAADDLDLLSSLTASVGLRYELARITAETLKTSGTPIDDAKLHQAFVYDLGLLFTPVPGMKIWAGHGTVFRYPFVDEQVSMYGYVTDTFYADLDPERGYNIEIGFEVKPARWLRWVSSGYLLDMNDEIAPDPVTFANVNLDKTRHLGAETAIELSHPKWLEVSGNYTFTLATFREGTHQGNRVPLVPLHQVSGKATLRFPLGFNVGVSGSYVTGVFAAGDLDNSQAMLPDYLLLGTFVRYQPDYVPGKLEVYVGVNNFLDVAYAPTGVYNGIEVYYYPGEGRSWKVGASYRY